MTNSTSILDLARQLFTAAQALVGPMRPALSAPNRPRCALFLTMLEQFESALHLAEVNLATHGAVHVRSMLEGLVAMNLLGQDAGYVDQMNYERLRGEKKLYENVLANTLNMAAGDRTEMEDRLITCTNQFNALHAKGLRPHVISKDFGKAGLADLLGHYMIFCNLSHNDLSALAYRHQRSNNMTYRAHDELVVMQQTLAVAMLALVSAAKSLNEIAKFPDGHFETHYQNMDELLGRLGTMGGPPAAR